MHVGRLKKIFGYNQVGYYRRSCSCWCDLEEDQRQGELPPFIDFLCLESPFLLYSQGVEIITVIHANQLIRALAPLDAVSLPLLASKSHSAATPVQESRNL